MLILDEPTNHLDIEAVDALAEALQRYGTVLVVSHDRAFLELIGDDVLEVADGTVHHRPDGFAAWLASANAEVANTNRASAGGAPDNTRDSTDIDPAERKAARRRIHELGKLCSSLERRLATQNKRREECEASMAADPDAAELVNDHAKAVTTIDALETEWLEADSELSDLRDRFWQLGGWRTKTANLQVLAMPATRCGRNYAEIGSATRTSIPT